MITPKCEGNTLTLVVALNVKPTASQSGKSRIVAKTGPFVEISTPFGMVKYNLNVITTDENYGKAPAKA
jgi:hypothetical protein